MSLPFIKSGQTITLSVADEGKQRTDHYLQKQFPIYSRSFFQRAIEDGLVFVNKQKIKKPGYALKQGDIIEVQFPAAREVDVAALTHDNLGIEVVYMHDHFIIINKPAGLLVHQIHAKHTEITVADWIKHKFADIGHVGCVDRPGIIHRLDKYTSGLMIIARTNYGYKQLGKLFHDRAIQKTYAAIVQHHPPQEGIIDLAIGRHQTHRTKMVATARAMPEDASGTFRHAVTHYHVLQYLNDATLVKVRLETGRTHQIRVHFAAIGFPLVGDILYGQKSPLIARQALHAWELKFVFDQKEYAFTSQLPNDMQECITSLQGG